MVINGDNWEKERLEILLSDRVANGEAFEGEKVCELWVHLQWFSDAYINGPGCRGPSGWLFPHEITE